MWVHLVRWPQSWIALKSCVLDIMVFCGCFYLELLTAGKFKTSSSRFIEFPRSTKVQGNDARVLCIMFSKTPGCPQGSLNNISLLDSEYVSFWEWFLILRSCSNGYTSVSSMSELKPDSSCSQADVTLNHPHNNFTMCSSTQTPPHSLSAEKYFTWNKIPIYTQTIPLLRDRCYRFYFSYSPSQFHVDASLKCLLQL